MKKTKILLPLLVLMAAMFALSACGTSGNGGKKEYGLNDIAIVENVYVALVSVHEDTTQTIVSNLAEDEVYVGLRFQVENKTGSDYTLSSILCFSVTNSDGTSLTQQFTSKFSNTLDGTITNNSTKTGYYVVKVKKTWTKLTIEFKPELLKSTKAKIIANKTDVSTND